jgi:hypothetical protein
LKTIKIFFTAFLLGSAVWVQAQTAAPETPPALDAAPPALSEGETKPQPAAQKPRPAPAAFVRKPQFSLSMGSQFSRFGQAAYLQPTVSYPLTRRLQAFASLQYLHTFGPGFYRTGPEAGASGFDSRGQQSYVVMAGGNYAVNEKLHITGSLWRDFAMTNGMAPQRLNPFLPAGSQGMMFRAHYKINDNLSVSGGLRYGNGRGYQGYNPHFYPDYNSPFGF